MSVARFKAQRCVVSMLLARVDVAGHLLRQKVPPWLAGLRVEKPDGRCTVHLMTFARVLTEGLQRGGLKDVAQLSISLSSAGV